MLVMYFFVGLFTRQTLSSCYLSIAPSLFLFGSLVFVSLFSNSSAGSLFPIITSCFLTVLSSSSLVLMHLVRFSPWPPSVFADIFCHAFQHIFHLYHSHQSLVCATSSSLECFITNPAASSFREWLLLLISVSGNHMLSVSSYLSPPPCPGHLHFSPFSLATSLSFVLLRLALCH